MATKLEIYNGTLVLLGARTLSALDDRRAERRSLDRVYGPVLAYMLEAALWHFAARTDEISASDTVESNFGYEYVFEKPDDYVRIMKISDNERLEPTLMDYSEESDYFLADVDPIYLQYVSSDSNYGGDPGKWAPSFVEAFVDEMAYRTAEQIARISGGEKDWLERKRKSSLYRAKSKSAVNQAARTLPTGRLVRSRGTSWANSSRRAPGE